MNLARSLSFIGPDQKTWSAINSYLFEFLIRTAKVLSALGGYVLSTFSLSLSTFHPSLHVLSLSSPSLAMPLSSPSSSSFLLSCMRAYARLTGRRRKISPPSLLHSSLSSLLASSRDGNCFRREKRREEESLPLSRVGTKTLARLRT